MYYRYPTTTHPSVVGEEWQLLLFRYIPSISIFSARSCHPRPTSCVYNLYRYLYNTISTIWLDTIKLYDIGTPHYDDNNNTTDSRRPVGTPAAADERIREFHRIYHLYYNVYYSKTTKSYDTAAAVSYWNHWNNSLFAQTCQIVSSPRHPDAANKCYYISYTLNYTATAVWCAYNIIIVRRLNKFFFFKFELFSN